MRMNTKSNNAQKEQFVNCSFFGKKYARIVNKSHGKIAKKPYRFSSSFSHIFSAHFEFFHTRFPNRNKRVILSKNSFMIATISWRLYTKKPPKNVTILTKILFGIVI